MQRLVSTAYLEFSRACGSCLLIFGLVFVVGCDKPIDSFESNRIYAKRLELGEDVELTSAVEDVSTALIELFGTPDSPRWPQFLQSDGDLGSLVSVERLSRAAGAVRSDDQDVHFGLYREHCIVCHATAGSGLGATSRLLNPYPRDFRLGKIKFKSTPRGKKPTREDLLTLLRRGIPGTSMPSFSLLNEEDLDALVDYVIYLSIRGEVERQLLTQATFELDLEEGERLVDFGNRESRPEDFAEQWSSVCETVTSVARQWQAAEQSSTQITPPPDLPLLTGDLANVDDPQIRESIAHGQQLFQGKVANCSSCHGMTAMGDGQTNDYDDWTKDWTVQAGLDPGDRQQLKPMLQLGALRPRHILPRNLRSGVFRGGSSPEDLYLRIVHGIDGTPMPAAPMQPENKLGLSERDVWDLVNYLLSLSRSSEIPADAESETVRLDREPMEVAAYD
jgi:mono/diheme cytochrome c family protein